MIDFGLSKAVERLSGRTRSKLCTKLWMFRLGWRGPSPQINEIVILALLSVYLTGRASGFHYGIVPVFVTKFEEDGKGEGWGDSPIFYACSLRSRNSKMLWSILVIQIQSKCFRDVQSQFSQSSEENVGDIWITTSRKFPKFLKSWDRRILMFGVWQYSSYFLLRRFYVLCGSYPPK